ncbi:MAG: alkaline phosphatase D family protein, partial [Janthinobacterium lividum]
MIDASGRDAPGGEGRTDLKRRELLSLAIGLGATLAWSDGLLAAAPIPWRERRDLYPQGVASGDPDHHSVLLWTRRPFPAGPPRLLTTEVALDPSFRTVVAQAHAPVSAEADWTARVLVAGLLPRTTYWYRFADNDGNGSRIGRTITAPRPDDTRPVQFAFVSCNSVNEGAQNAFRRMIWEDEQAGEDRRLGFVLHLGDFIYEVVEYPDEVPHRYSRTVYDLGRVPDARKVGNFHVPTNLAGYRHVYRAHLDDPDIQDARAHFPFVCIGDNHEFSWAGWQSFIKYPGTGIEPAQPLRVAANQAWWEYIPSRVCKASGAGLDHFGPPAVVKSPIDTFDDYGFGTEANNRAAVGSMTAYRSMRYGGHVDLILTDFHSYQAADPMDRPEAAALDAGEFPVVPQEWMEITDAGRDYA